MIPLPTYDELKALYLSLAQSQYNEADISTFTDFNAKASGTGGMGARLSLDTFKLFNAIYPQNGDAFGINSQLAAKGVPSQYPATPTLVTADVVGAESGKTYELPVGTVISSDNGVQYKIVSPDGVSLVVQVTSDLPTFQLVSVTKGTATNIADSATLTFSPPQFPVDGTNFPISTAIVDSSIPGVDMESLGSAINRLVEIQQIPLNGNRSTDFKYIAYDPANGVNDVVVLVNNQLQYTNPLYNTGIFDVGGTPITDEILNQGLVVGTTTILFDRSVPEATYDATQVAVIAENICGVFPVSNTVSTQAITTLTDNTTPFIKIEVTFQSGYSLTSVVQVNGINFTLTQLIKRETRRAICGQLFGAVLVRDYTTGAISASSIATSSIEQQLDESMGTPTTVGSLGNYLSSRSVLIYDTMTTDYAYQPTIPLALGIPTDIADPLEWVYDISLTPSKIYTNIGVALIT